MKCNIIQCDVPFCTLTPASDSIIVIKVIVTPKGSVPEENQELAFGQESSNHVDHDLVINPFTPELKKCILPTFQNVIVWVM